MELVRLVVFGACVGVSGQGVWWEGVGVCQASFMAPGGLSPDFWRTDLCSSLSSGRPLNISCMAFICSWKPCFVSSALRAAAFAASAAAVANPSVTRWSKVVMFVWIGCSAPWVCKCAAASLVISACCCCRAPACCWRAVWACSLAARIGASAASSRRWISSWMFNAHVSVVGRTGFRKGCGVKVAGRSCHCSWCVRDCGLCSLGWLGM